MYWPTCGSVHKPHTSTHTHTQPSQPTMLSQRKAAASLPETIAGLSAAAQNKRRAARWSSLLLRVSLRAAARASVGVGVSRGFSDDSTAINTYINSALLCFLLSLVCRRAIHYQSSQSSHPNAPCAGALLCSTHTWLCGLCY